MATAIQVVEETKGAIEAIRIWAWLQTQDNYLAGRMLMRDGKYSAQTFHNDDGITKGWLPDGMRHVVLVGSMARLCGF